MLNYLLISSSHKWPVPPLKADEKLVAGHRALQEEISHSPVVVEFCETHFWLQALFRYKTHQKNYGLMQQY
jgi:hypothetical protein